MRRGRRNRVKPEEPQQKSRYNKMCPRCGGPMDTEWAIPRGRGVQWICSGCYKPYAAKKKREKSD